MQKQTHLERVVFAFHGDQDGRAKGAHVEYFTVIKDDDGTEIARKLEKPVTFSVAGLSNEAHPAVLAGINVGLALTVDQQAAELQQLRADLGTAASALDQCTAERDAAQADAAALRAKYESPVSTNGVPEWVYASQAYKALVVAGKLDTLRAALDVAAQQGQAGMLAKVDFEKSARFYRAHPTVAMFIASGLFTDAEVDALFKLAATFPV